MDDSQVVHGLEATGNLPYGGSAFRLRQSAPLLQQVEQRAT